MECFAKDNRISMCKTVSSCIFFSDGLNKSSLAMWLLDPARNVVYEAIKASNLRDVRTGSASNTTLSDKVNSTNATYMLKLTIKWEEKDPRNEGQWRLKMTLPRQLVWQEGFIAGKAWNIKGGTRLLNLQRCQWASTWHTFHHTLNLLS